MSLIPSGVKAIYNQFADEMINNDIIGQSCTLHYKGKRIDCNNCVFSTFGGGQPTNVYQNGGPAPFSFGQCPMCDGRGYKEQEVTSPIRLRCYAEQKEWRKIVGNIEAGDSKLLTIGFMSDLPDVLKCKYMSAINAQSGNLLTEYVLDGKPNAHGFYKDRYFYAMWKLK